MFGINQTQEAGDNAQQINASQIVINNNIGIDEKRAREIVDEKLNQTLQIYFNEANNIAAKRMNNFADKFIPDLVKENLLESLREPSIQIMLLDAQRSAASTERPADYSMLSELLIRRIKKGQDRNIIAGVSGAIKILNEISDEALLGLTVLYSLQNFRPILPKVKDCLTLMNDIFSKIIIDNPLPEGDQWLDNLDILKAARLEATSQLKKFNVYYPEKLSGYIEAGIKKLSNEYDQALSIINDSGLPENILCDNQLLPDYIKLGVADLYDIDKIKLIATLKINNQLLEVSSLPLSQEQKKALKKIHMLYDKDKELQDKSIEIFINLWDNFPILKKIRIWWDNIPSLIIITSIGKALAHSNARRLYPSLPEWDDIS